MSSLPMNVAAIVLGVCVTSGTAGVTCGAEPVADKAMKEMTLREYLRQIGVEADVYFTVETYGRIDGPFALLGTSGTFDVSARGEEGIVSSIEAAIPGVSVKRSKAATVVYHIYGPGCQSIPGYWMEGKITLSFSGAVMDLFGVLQKACDNEVRFEHVTVYGSSIPMVDGSTRIAVQVRDTGVRDAITCCWPYSEQDRILWTCSTRTDKEAVAHLAFGFPADKPKGGRSKVAIPFEQGEAAYRMTASTPKALQEAVAYITEQLKMPAPRQVRWAMFYVGKHGTLSEMRLLFKHLDYRYVKSGLVEEQYPAVRALYMSGEKALPVAIEALKTEEDPVRLKLLRHVIAAIAGKQASEEMIKNRALRGLGGEQRARIKSASSSMGPTTLPAAKKE